MRVAGTVHERFADLDPLALLNVVYAARQGIFAFRGSPATAGVRLLASERDAWRIELFPSD